MKKYIGLLIGILTIVSCESLEDTYKDYAGNGPSVTSVNVLT